MKVYSNQIFILKEEQLDAVPSQIKIIPLGDISSEKGNFKADEESFKAIEREFKRRGLDLVVDYEHQTLHDVQAPAAGWIKSLRLSSDAIVADVEWTNRAAEYLRNKEYKYLSPVVRVRKSDKKAVALHSVALTNTPAINQMPALVLKNIEEEKSMEFLKEIAEKLDITVSEEMGEEEIAKAIFEALPSPTAAEEVVANKTILDLLELKEDAKVEDVTSKIMSLKSSKTDEGWKTKYKELEERMNRKEADELVLKALKEGKISKEQKEWAQEYALKDKQSFEKFLEKAPVVVPVGEIQVANSQKNISDDEEMLKVCKMLGVSEEDIKKYGKDEI